MIYLKLVQTDKNSRPVLFHKWQCGNNEQTLCANNNFIYSKSQNLAYILIRNTLWQKLEVFWWGGDYIQQCIHVHLTLAAR
jgi:hypothetical protein